MFSVPSNFLSMADIKKEIYSTLISGNKYYVKSNVSANIFQNFINHCINKERLEISINNISEYDQLSDEFGEIRDIVELYKKYSSNATNSTLLRKKQSLNDTVKRKTEYLTQNADKYQQIIHHLFNSKGIYSNSKFFEIKNELFNKCYNEKIFHVDLLTRELFEKDGLLYALDENEKKAGVFRNVSAKGDIFIPKSITYNSEEFLIIQIFDESFVNDQNVKSIQFPENSELKIIGKNAFSLSSIERIKIPSHVTEIGSSAFSECQRLKLFEFSENSELKSIEKLTFSGTSIQFLTIPSSVEKLDTEWCSSTPELNNIFVHEKNQFFKNFDSFVIGKSDENFDVLYFAPRNIQTAIIPSFIKQIAPYSFHQCKNLHTIEFEKNSELYYIGYSSFILSSIQRISIPSSVLHIDLFSFSHCENLEKVEFESNSKLCSIGHFAFFENNSLHSISLPIHLKSVGECAFSKCENLKKVEFPENSELKIIEPSIFSQSPIESLSIPSSVEYIEEEWCRGMSDLINVKILPSKKENICYYENSLILGKIDSKSDKFDVILFARKNIQKVKIPSFIKRIASYAFSDCYCLEKVEFSENSELNSIGEYSFAYSMIKRIIIPPKVTQIEEESFTCCSQLKSIEFSENSKLNSMGKFVFYYCPLENIVIPSSFANFKAGWCFGAPNLNNINIRKCKEENISYYKNSFILGKSDQKSDIFDVLLFSRRNIKNVKIPFFIKRIAPYAFCECKFLENLEFENNSKLESIENYSFAFSSIKNILIPNNVIKIMDGAFDNCSFFNRIQFSEPSQLNSIGRYVFNKSHLESIFIPSNVSMIGLAAFSHCKHLIIIEFSENSELKIINKKLFQDSSLDIIMVPEKLKKSLNFIL